MSAPGISHHDWLGRAAALKPPDKSMHALEKYTEFKTTWIAL